MQGDLCHVSGGNSLAFKYGGDSLIFKGDAVSDAVVTVDWEPKSWRCATYGQLHAMYADIRPSWATSGTHARAWTQRLSLADLVRSNTHTLTVAPAPAHCEAGEDKTKDATFTVNVRQGNGATNATLTFTLRAGNSRKITIVQQGGRILLAY